MFPDFLLRTASIVLLNAAGAASPSLPGNVVAVKAGNFYFQAPDSIPAGLTTFTLQSADSGHVLLIVRLEKGHTAAEAMRLAAMDSVPDWATFLSGPITTKSKRTNATLDLVPGNYLLLCYFHEGEKAHSSMGMQRALRVVPRSARKSPALVPDLTVSLVNYDFKISAPLTPGRYLVRFVNTSNEPHEVIMMRIGEGTPDERFAAGIGILPPHGSVLSTIDFPPATYEWSCHMSDPKGKDHAEMGMRRRFVVKA
jgi:plastocyanin